MWEEHCLALYSFISRENQGMSKGIFQVWTCVIALNGLLHILAFRVELTTFMQDELSDLFWRTLHRLVLFSFYITGSAFSQTPLPWSKSERPQRHLSTFSSVKLYFFHSIGWELQNTLNGISIHWKGWKLLVYIVRIENYKDVMIKKYVEEVGECGCWWPLGVRWFLSLRFYLYPPLSHGVSE